MNIATNIPNLEYCKENVLAVIRAFDENTGYLQPNQQKALENFGILGSRTTISNARRKLLYDYDVDADYSGEWTIISPHVFKKLVELLRVNKKPNGLPLLELDDNSHLYSNRFDILFHTVNDFFDPITFDPRYLAGRYICYKTSVVNPKIILRGTVNIIYEELTNSIHTYEVQPYWNDGYKGNYEFEGVLTLPNKRGQIFWIDRDINGTKNHIRDMRIIYRDGIGNVLSMNGWSYFDYTGAKWARCIFLQRFEQEIICDCLPITDKDIPEILKKYRRVDKKQIDQSANVIKFFNIET